MIAYLFPGQGSQIKGMGEGLFDDFKELVTKADNILGYSIEELCLEDPNDQLQQTDYTQPALYVVNALSYLKILKETGRKPDYVAGHSLGEYNALLAAGAFDFETGLKLVVKRGELMGRASGGGMAAVIGLNEETCTEIIKHHKLSEIDVANLNSPQQIVISGPKHRIEQAKAIFEDAGARAYVILKVSGAFHSRYMEYARERFEAYAAQFEFSKIEIPVISNVYARPYKYKDLRNTLVNQIVSPVKWSESIRYLMGKNVSQFIQVGPGNVLSALVKTIQREAEPLRVTDEDEDDGQNQDADQVNGEEDSEPMRGLVLASSPSNKPITAESLGNQEFKERYGLKYAYLTGSMYKGISSKQMVVKVGKAGMMGFFGAGGMKLEALEDAIHYIQNELNSGEAYGMNLIHVPDHPDIEDRVVDLYLKHRVRNIEASAFMSITPSLIRYRLNGLKRDSQGGVVPKNRILAKVSRPEVFEAFLSPAPQNIVDKLLADNKITRDEALMAMEIPMADDLCVEADSGGHTDKAVAYVLVPLALKMRDEAMAQYKYHRSISVGAAGGIGTPQAAASAFMLGADFIMTGSINQCTVEAGTSDEVKDLLQQLNIQDTEYAPAGDMFELGAQIQVMKKGVFFPARANKLYDLYRHYNSIDEIDYETKKYIEEKFFKKSMEDVYEDIKSYYPAERIEKAEKNPKRKMALIFKWYFAYSTRLALNGDKHNKVDYQVHCGPALGAFNQWVKGTALENWRNRHVDEIGIKIMVETAQHLNDRYSKLR
ncbi:ACP S-malonyltransferase [Paenibacillus xylaniclasticus]|uniref:ACP S-malonyltransferase n=1 Tax=Paenibacillus xylaniclasticus TaxID=588083 RepID=UPI0015B8F880|nr:MULTISPECIES: ACP S-malonyltransferase [Paenibacillus]